jgi:hypothetical protein
MFEIIRRIAIDVKFWTRLQGLATLALALLAAPEELRLGIAIGWLSGAVAGKMEKQPEVAKPIEERKTP